MPGLPKRYYDFQFGVSGQEQKIDKKVIQGPRLSRVINGEILTPGVVQKRNGYQKLEDDGVEDYGLNWGTRISKDNSIVAVCDHAIKDYSSNAEDSGSWLGDRCSALPISTVDKILSKSSGVFKNPYIEYANNKIYLVVVREAVVNQGNLFIYDAETLVLLKQCATPFGAVCKIINVNDSVFIFATSSTGTTISMYVIDNDTDDITDTYTSITDRDTSIDGSVFDIDTDGTYIYVAYNISSGIAVRAINTSGSSVYLQYYLSHGKADQSIAIHLNIIDSTNICVAFCNSSDGTRFVSFDADLDITDYGILDASILNARVITVGTYDEDDTFIIAVEYLDADIESDMSSNVQLFHIEINGSYTSLYYASCVSLTHKICHYTDDGDFDYYNRYIGIGRKNTDYTTALWGAFYTCQITHVGSGYLSYTRIEPIAKYLYRMNAGLGNPVMAFETGNYICSCVDIGNNKFISAGMDIDGNVCLFTCDMTRSKQGRLNAIRYNKDIVACSSIPVLFDSQAIKEIGFSFPPYIVDYEVTTGGSGDIDAGTYNFIVIYEAYDKNGRLYKSPLSLPQEVVCASAYSNVEIFFTAAIYRPDWDSEVDSNRKPRAVLYRTEDGGSLYYKTAEQDFPTDDAWFNNTDGESLKSLTSIENDTDLIDNEALYTTGGVLERCAPPPLIWSEIHDNRIFGIDSETENIVYSSESLEGEGPWFNAVFVIDNPADLGIPVALISVPTGLMVFWKNQIGMIYGEGPNDLGIGSTYTIPRVLNDKIGCIEQKSLIKTPIGIIFKASSGFHIVGYDGSPPQYIGSGVYDFDGDEVIDASLVESKKQVRFTIVADSVSAGTLVLVYSYEFNQWYVWGQTTDIDDFSEWITPYGGGSLDNAHHIVGYQGNTLVQGSTFQDGTIGSGPAYSLSNYYMIIETGWLSLAGIQGFQRCLRCWLLGEYIDTHDLRIEIDYDFNEENTQTVTISDSDLSGLDTYQVRFGIVRQRCQAIKFKIMVITSSANKEGARLNALRLEYMIKKGSMRLQSS